MSRKSIVLLFALLIAALIAGCAPAAPAPVAPPATKTPKPTFTPTIPPTEIPIPTLAPTQPPATVAPAATEAQAQATTAPAAAATAAPTKAAPAETRLTATSNVNVRSGPGTAYPAVGRLTAGQSFVVSGKNDGGDWLKFDFNGKDGWVTAALVTVEGDLGGIEIAQAPAIPTPRPQPTARPRPVQPTAAPQPTNPPAPPPSAYTYSRATVTACRPQAGGTWFDGVVKRGGNPVNGERVVFSWAPDGAPITPPAVTGPHEGYPGWNPGYFSHIISAPPDPKKGDWYVWVVDASGKRISEIAHWTSTGPGEGGCNDASIAFEG